MPTIVESDLARMRAGLFFEGPERGRKLSRFWTLLTLAAIIASAGVIADSTATVIGAMIVAPLMTPILGTVLSIVTADRPNFLRSVALVVTGALAVIAIGWLAGTLVPVHVTAETSSQVASRIHPRLIDLVAALATGAVGAFALVREDVADTLPGVAIAISLVPPLAVVGLTLEAGEGSQSFGALLLFLTNVAAILVSGVVVMALYRVPRMVGQAPESTMRHRRSAIAAVVVMLVAIALPLTVSTVRVAQANLRRGDIARVTREWASPAGWKLVSVEPGDEATVVRVVGPLPNPDPTALRAALDGAGMRGVTIRLEMIPETDVELPGT